MFNLKEDLIKAMEEFVSNDYVPTSDEVRYFGNRRSWTAILKQIPQAITVQITGNV